MSKTNVQLLFTEEEFAKLKNEADKCELTVPLYIKSKVLGENEFFKWYKILLEEVEKLDSGTKFDIKSVFGTSWIKVDRGIKLNLGKTFYNRVFKGVITNVKDIGQDSSNVMWYEKL